MEFIALDISLLVISIIVATIVILLYSFASEILYENHHCLEDFAVIDIVRYLKKLCPINFVTKWRLLPLNSGLSRCWTKNVQLPGFQNSLNLYGVACAVPCSSMYAFSLISDVSKWGEWDHLPLSQGLLLKPFSENKLQKDKFMRADQVVGIQRGTNVQSYIAMYRFMSFSEKTVKWILFWNVKKVEFMFFLIQPAISKTADSQCLITHIFGSKQLLPRVATSVAQRVKNIKEFLLLSQLHIVASNCAPTISAISVSSPNSLKPGKNIKSEEAPDVSTQHMFMLVPITQKLTRIYERLKGFQLTIKVLNADLKQKQGQKKTIKRRQQKPKSETSTPVETKATMRRTLSESFIKTKHDPKFISSLDLATYADTCKTSKIIGTKGLRRTSSIIVEEALKLDLDSKIAIENASSAEQPHSFSDPVTPSAKNKLSHSDGSDIHTDDETYVHLHIIHEDEQNLKNYDKNDFLCSSTSEFDSMDTYQQFLDCKIADFLTQGNYGASELQAEMLLASQYDKNLGPDENISGNWIYHSNYKGITVLSKTTAGQFMKILSFLCQTELSASCEDVWKCVKNPRFRFYYDETVKTVKIIERISDSQKLIHIYHEINSGLLRKEAMDFCLLQTEREEANQFYSSFHSMEYEKCPFMNSVIRGSLRPSGWVVEHLGPKKCKVTYLMQVLVNSPDSLYIYQLTTLVPLALHNLKNYMASMPS